MKRETGCKTIEEARKQAGGRRFLLAGLLGGDDDAYEGSFAPDFSSAALRFCKSAMTRRTKIVLNCLDQKT